MGDLRNDIEKYLRGELSPAERHALEKRALTDPFLADALEGGETISIEDFSADLKSLQQNLQDRIQRDHKKIVPLWSWPMRIAAGLLVLATATFVVYQITSKNTDESDRLAQNKQTPKTETPAGPQKSADSISAPSVQAEEQNPASATTSGETTKTKTKAATRVGTEESKTTPENGYLALRKDAAQPSKEKTESAPALEPATKPVAAAPETEVDFLDDAVEDLDSDTSLAQEETKGRDKVGEALQGKIAGVQATKKKQDREDSAPGLLHEPANTIDGFSYNVTKTDSVAGEDSKRLMQVRSRLAVAPKVIRGKVTSAEDGSGLPGVNVAIKGTETGTVTDAEGNYEIPVEATEPGLVFSFIGMENQEVSIGDATEVNVAMNPDMTQLSEVVVVGYTVEPKDDIIGRITFATPAGGRAAFKRYIESNLRYPEQALENKVEGRVTVQFTVETSGSLTNMRVVKGIGHGCDEEVVRLIKEGPKWQPTRKDDEPIIGKIKIRVRFKLPKK
jgi:TonB family protein